MTDFRYEPGTDDMADMPRAEKLIRTLPAVRISETLDIELMRLAAQADRKYSDFVRRVLHAYVFGHGSSVDGESKAGNSDRA